MERIEVVKFLDSKVMNKETYMHIENELQILENNSFFSHAFSTSNLEYEFIDNPFSIIYFYYKDEKLVGYLDYWITFDSATIFRIGGEKDLRKFGIASKLMDKMLEDISNSSEEISMITLEVRVSNEPAKNLYKKYGFNEISIKKNYYDNGEDAIFMGRGQ